MWKRKRRRRRETPRTETDGGRRISGSRETLAIMRDAIQCCASADEVLQGRRERLSRNKDGERSLVEEMMKKEEEERKNQESTGRSSSMFGRSLSAFWRVPRPPERLLIVSTTLIKDPTLALTVLPLRHLSTIFLSFFFLLLVLLLRFLLLLLPYPLLPVPILPLFSPFPLPFTFPFPFPLSFPLSITLPLPLLMLQCPVLLACIGCCLGLKTARNLANWSFFFFRILT